REELAYECLIDDPNFRRMIIVLCRKAAPTQQGNLHRGKIIFAHRLPHGFVTLGGLFSFARQQKTIEPIVIRNEWHLRERGRVYAGNIVQPRKELLIEA